MNKFKKIYILKNIKKKPSKILENVKKLKKISRIKKITNKKLQTKNCKKIVIFLWKPLVEKKRYTILPEKLINA